MKSHRKNHQNLSVDQLKLGMYVIAITHRNDILKSEGYISSPEALKSLKKLRVTTVTVDPSKEKNVETIDKVINPRKVVESSKEPSLPSTVPFDQEIKKASGLYKSAKNVQQTILDHVRIGKALDGETIRQSTDSIVDSIFRNQDALSCMSRMQSKDTYLMEHSLNVAILMSIFAKHLGMDKRVIQELALGCFLHDIGKVLIPKSILYKKIPLTKQEMGIVRSHVALGLKILESTPSVSHIAVNIVKEHHERIDGSGYPYALKGDQISKHGKMVAIVDSFHAMVSERHHQKSMHPVNAFKVLISESPTLYDEYLVEKFVQSLGVYPVGTLVKLNSGKLGLISQRNIKSPLEPCVKVFYNTRLNQAVPIEEIDLSKCKYKDQIDRCINPDDFNINLLGFFKTAFID